MTNYPIKSLDNKFTYGIGINDNHKSEPKIIIQLSDIDNQQQVRVSMDREEFYQFTDKLKEYYLHYF
jgi:hypothetical protein